MWSDIKANHNKFYISQALECNGDYSLWTRYGRVGIDGVGSNLACRDHLFVCHSYHKTYRTKTGKGYTEVKMALGKPAHVEVKMKAGKDVKAKEADKLPESALDENLQSLISFIFDLKLIEESVI